MLYEKFPEHRYRNRKASVENTMWNTGGKNNKKIAEYIRNQLEEDQEGERLKNGELLDSPFTGSK